MKVIKKLLSIITAGVVAAGLVLPVSGVSFAEEIQKNMNTEEQGAMEDVFSGMTAFDWTNAVDVQINSGELSVSAGGESSVEYTDTVLFIREAGTYILSGELYGKLIVDIDKDEEIVLVLNGFQVVNEEGKALVIRKAAKATIVINDRTDNSIVSGSPIALAIEEIDPGFTLTEDESALEAATEEDENKTEETGYVGDGTISNDSNGSGAALVLKADTVITGTGRLTISGYLKNGIKAVKNLIIESGNICIEAVKNGIKGNADVTINGGTLYILAGRNIIKADGKVTDNAGFTYNYIDNAE